MPNFAQNKNKMEKELYSERFDGNMPNGGVYAIAYYSDADSKPCDKSKAARVEIVEFSSDGHAITRTYGDCES